MRFEVKKCVTFWSTAKGTVWTRVIFHIFVPTGIALGGLGLNVTINQETHGLIVSVFSIVSALLFGSLFSIFSAASSIDRTKIAREFRNLASFKRDLRSINRWVLYLVLLSTATVFLTLVFYLLALPQQIESGILIF